MPTRQKEALRAQIEPPCLDPAPGPKSAPMPPVTARTRGPVGYLLRGPDGRLHVSHTKNPAGDPWDDTADAANARLARSLA